LPYAYHFLRHHTKGLVRKLKAAGYDAIRLKYPVYNLYPSGEYLNKILRSGTHQTIDEHELQLWFVINRYQFQPTLEKWLKNDRIVIAEDYSGTGIAWGTAKGVKTKWLESINQNLIKENLAIFLDGNRSIKAIETGHIHEENYDLIKRCQLIHRKLARKYNWKRIKVQPKKNDTLNLIWEKVAPYLPS